MAAVAFTPEQFEAFLERMAGRRDAQAATATSGTKASRRRITSKEIRLANFDGTAASWTNWSFGFKVAVKSVCTRAFELLNAAERYTGEATDEVLEVDEGNAKEISGEIYGLLCQYLSGESMTIIKGVPDCQGLWAWQRLHRKFSPRTMARAIRVMSEVMNPGHIKHVKDVEAGLTVWEGKRSLLEEEFKEVISNAMHIAILTSMMPSVVQDFIYQSGRAC